MKSEDKNALSKLFPDLAGWTEIGHQVMIKLIFKSRSSLEKAEQRINERQIILPSKLGVRVMDKTK